MITDRGQPRALLALVAGILLTLVVAVGVVPPRSSSASEELPPSPLATSVSIDGATFAAIPMGDLSEPLNTFWQLFKLSAGSVHWTLDTPPGIADNGGLVIEGGSPSLLAVAIRPSNLLTFTAIAVLGAHANWSNGGLIPGALVGAPTAFVGTKVASFAAVKTAGGAVVRSKNGLSSWTRIGTAAELSAVAAGTCRVRAVDALATNAGLPLYAGVSCSAGNRAGIFAFDGSSWRVIGPKLGRLGTGASRTVLMLSASPLGLTAIIATTSTEKIRLVVARSSNGSSWASTPPLSLPASASIASLGTTGNAGAYVVWRENGVFAAVATANNRWSTLPRLPDDALTIALPQGPSGSVDAVGGRHSTFLGWRLDRGTSRWQQTESFTVPILYGSSS